MRRQEIHLRRHGKMPQLRRLTTGRRGLPAALADGLFQPTRIISCLSAESGLPSGSRTIKVSIAMPSRVVKICAS